MKKNHAEVLTLLETYYATPEARTITGRFDLLSRLLSAMSVAFYTAEEQARVRRAWLARNQPYRNIIVPDPGFQAKRPTIVVCAHYDVCYQGEAYENANDNTAGLVAGLSVLQDLHALPDRQVNVVYIFTDGEENGGCGVQISAGSLREQYGQHGLLVLNLDMVGIGDTFILKTYPGREIRIMDMMLMSDVQQTINATVPQQPLVFWDNIPFNDSDIFARYDIPCLLFSRLPVASIDSGAYKRDIWGVIHSPKDTFDTLEPDSIRATGAMLKHIVVTV